MIIYCKGMSCANEFVQRYESMIWIYTKWWIEDLFRDLIDEYYIEIMMKLYWNYTEIILKLYWNYIEIILKLYWNYDEYFV